MKKISVFIADDHSIIRIGLKTLLRYAKDIETVGEAANGRDAVQLAATCRPDVAIMDLKMPIMDGVEATRLIKAQTPETKVLLLTSYGDLVDVANAVTAGASGAIMKDTPNEELPGIIRRIAAGEKVFSSEIVQSIKSAPPTLSERKREILRLVAKGFTSANIAKMLKISKYAVDQHLSATCEKLGASSRTEAVSIAINRNMIKT